MKIGFDARRYFLNRTGLGDYSRNLIEHLHAHYPEEELHLYTSDTGEHYPVPEFAHIHTKGKSASVFWRNFGIPSALKKNQINLYHGLSNELPLGIGKSGVPSLVTIHDLLFVRYPAHYAHFDRKIYSLKTKKACTLAQHIVCISDVTKKDLIHLFGVPEEKISVVAPIATFVPSKKVIPAGSIPRSSEKTTPYILCVSSFQRRKNLERLIEAYNASNSGYRLIIAGRKGETSRECAYLVNSKKSGIKAELRFDVSHAELETLFENASAFIYPSLYEGFGMPVLDAIHHKLPVLTGKGTSMEEIAGDAGIYFDPENIESMINALRYLEESEFDASQYALRAEKRLMQFSGNILSEKLINIYRKFGN